MAAGVGSKCENNFRRPAIRYSRPLLRVLVSALSTHIEDVVNLLRWEDLSDVILCGHSYAGIVASGVADRVPERIRALVYLDAFVPEDGESLFDIHPPGLAEHMRILAQRTGDRWNVPPIPAERFNINPRDAAWVNRQCTSQSIATFEEHIKLNRMSSRTHDATYILATEWDNSPLQASYERAKAKGWKTRTIACGHEVTLDRPGELTDLLLEFAISSTRSPGGLTSIYEENPRVAQ